MCKRVESKNKKPYLLTFIAMAFFLVLLEGLGMLEGLDRQVYDLFFRIRGSRDPGQKIVVAAIDEKTLSELGKWPLSRKYYADLLGHLKLADSVVFDILMPEPSEHDPALADAIRRHGKVVLPVHIAPDGHPVYPAFPMVNITRGHVHIGLGIDGIARDVFHTICCNGVSLPSLTLAVYASLMSHASGSRIGKQEECQSGLRQTDLMTINYYGPAGTFQHISFSEIIQGDWPPSFFRGKIVLVGVTASGIEEGLLSPFTSNRNRLHGIEAHANILNNLLEGSDIRSVPERIRLLFAISLAAVFLVFCWRYSPTVLFFPWIGCLISVPLMTYAFFSLANIWIPPGIPWTAITGSFLAAHVLELRRMVRSVSEARREWEESFNTIDDAILIQDSSGNFVRKNRAADEMPGNILAEELRRRFTNLMAESAIHVVANTPPGENENRRAEPEEMREAETGKSYEIKSLPREDGNGKFLGAVHVVRDITRRKKAQEKEQELQQMLLQAQKMEAIGTLAGGIAHDFNNILGTIVGYTELVWHSLSPEQTAPRSKLEQVLKASERARDLIMQILTFSRKTEHERKIILLRPILREGLKLFRTALPKSIDVREDLSSDVRAEIDPTQLYQILMNLCTNAYHSMRDGGGTLAVSLKPVTLDTPLFAHDQQLPVGAYINLTVRDSGQGISREDGEKIFEPYFTTKAKGEGTGLGLAIVRRIAQDHGGLVTFESNPEEGTSFSVYLPRADKITPELPETISDDTMTPGTGNILLVDDNPQMALLVKQMLERIGYHVETRLAPLEAYEAFKARSTDFDLVMTDLDMPDMTGLELAEKLLAIRPDTAIILSTGYCEPATQERAHAIGIKAVIFKPFHASALSRLIAGVLAGKPPK
ncbi:MAG: CHASE2 domain-containing protein [Pseudomonadota bacterium]